MGLPMANNLARAGLIVHGHDTQVQQHDERIEAGVSLHSSLEECVSGANTIITMLPNGGIVLDVLQRIINTCTNPLNIVDCSTVDINDARRAHQMASDNGHDFLDAPVSGGIKGAAAGTLTAMIGGKQQTLQALEHVLDPLFGNIIHCGGAGNGQAAKICNNMLLATSMIGTGEAFNLGDKLGLDANTLFNILSTSTGSCWSVNSYCPVPGVGPQSPSDNDYQPGFSSHMMLKDMKLTQAAASSVEVATPLGADALNLYERFVEQGGGPSDFSAIIRYLQSLER